MDSVHSVEHWNGEEKRKECAALEARWLFPAYKNALNRYNACSVLNFSEYMEALKSCTVVKKIQKFCLGSYFIQITTKAFNDDIYNEALILIKDAIISITVSIWANSVCPNPSASGKYLTLSESYDTAATCQGEAHIRQSFRSDRQWTRGTFSLTHLWELKKHSGDFTTNSSLQNQKYYHSCGFLQHCRHAAQRRAYCILFVRIASQFDERRNTRVQHLQEGYFATVQVVSVWWMYKWFL